jgi:hypothetical protein
MLAIQPKLCMFRVKRTITFTDFVNVIAEDDDSAHDAAADAPLDWDSADPNIETSDVEFIGAAE